MRSVAVHTDASAEAEEAALWYDGERAGLGADFQMALQQAFATLHEGIIPGLPWRGRLGAQGVKYIMLKRFPFKVVFVELELEIVVLAVAHHSRRPAYWKARVQDSRK